MMSMSRNERSSVSAKVLCDDLLTKLSAELRDKAIEIRTGRMEAAKEALENDEGSTNADL